MIKIAHISDLHVGTAPPEACDALASDLKQQEPDYTVISGDLTQWATPREFKAAASFISGLSSKVLVVAGNHDLIARNPWTRIMSPYKPFKRLISPNLEPRLVDPSVAMCGLNSPKRIMPHWNWSHGRLSRRQVRDFEGFFADLPADTKANSEFFRLLTFHHPLIRVKHQTAGRPIGRARAVMEAASRVSVDAVLTGHTHKMSVQLREGQAGWSFACIAAGSAISPRERDNANSYNVIAVADNAMTVSARVLDGNTFSPGRSEQLMRDPSTGWSFASAG